MPMARDEDVGTEKDGSTSADSCRCRYRDGRFVDPDSTLDGIIEFCARKMAELGIMPYDPAKNMTGHVLPTLKRWKN
ncbi:MAG: zinc ribbon domain-containing protein [Methanomicrobiaceae archaeon]|nr:zinc ribbon domain-containing protein [Methanomicrobiaceae archaeon]